MVLRVPIAYSLIPRLKELLGNNSKKDLVDFYGTEMFFYCITDKPHFFSCSLSSFSASRLALASLLARSLSALRASRCAFDSFTLDV